MSMPSLDPVTPMEIAQQPVPNQRTALINTLTSSPQPSFEVKFLSASLQPLQPLPNMTPMDTTPAPVNTVTSNLTGNIVTTATTHSNIVSGNLSASVPPAVTAPTVINKPIVAQATTPSLNISSPTTSSVPSSLRSTISSSVAPSSTLSSAHEPTQVLSRARLQDLVREVDPSEQLDEEVEELLLQLADDFVENAVNAACQFAKHRRANTIDVKDVQLHLERNWNMWIPGFGTDELRPYKRASVTEAHKQRLALIRKALKKY